MEDIVCLTKNDLCKRWQLSLQTINTYIEDGIITPIRLPSVRFHPKHIAELEKVKLEKFSPLERRRLEKELEYWKKRAEDAEAIVAKVNIVTTESMYKKQMEVV
jgi:hypothetical protein